MRTTLSFLKIVYLLLAFACSMIAVRFLYSGEHRFLFISWNLFLAWLPWRISTQFNSMQNKHRLQQALLLLVWLLFFPNALYVVTDLIHLQAVTIVPVWFDAILLFAAAVTGLVMAFASLLRLEEYVQTKYSERFTAFLIAFVLFLGSFGVYLGRFLRWNSWDILKDPAGVFYQIAHRIIFPLSHGRTWGITLLLSVFFYLLWLLVKKMPGHIGRASYKV